MSLAPVITFDDPKKLPPLLRLSQGVQRPDVRKVMGRAIGTVLRKHFTKLDRERKNKMGGERTHFYADARRGVQQPELVGGDGVKVTVNKLGLALRYFGGDVVAGQNGSGRKYLTIPIHPEAYGHRAREFDDLHFLPSSDGRRAWLTKDTSATVGGMQDEFFYLLVRRAHYDADPTVLPPEEETQGAALKAGEEFISVLIERDRN